MTIPRATARLQFNRDFTLDDAREQVPYLAELGISHVYASPLTVARAGSTHGYDVIDHSRINPELGGEAALYRLVECLREFGMGLILDIVPNHMATDPHNAAWWSVLETGPASPYADWFDIDWRSPDPALNGKLLAPFLGQPYGEALAAGDLKLVYDEAARCFRIEAYGAPYPVAPGHLPDGATLSAEGAATLVRRHDPADPGGRKRLHELLERQNYRLAWWRTAPEEINWRRFFEVSELAGVCVERPAVFDAVHERVLRLYEEGWIDGVRVDHVDGLADPIAYCRQLRAALRQRSAARPGTLAGDDPYLVIEKILAHDETLDARWDVHGSTGYDFMAQVQAVAHDERGLEPLTRLWQEISGDRRPVLTVLRDARRLMLQRHFPVERRATVLALHAVARQSIDTRDVTASAIGRALDAVLLDFPVYRTYADDAGRGCADQALMEGVLQRAHDQLARQQDGSDAPLLAQLDAWLGGEPPGRDASGLRRQAIRRFQQLTPPLAAKSLEDTTFYQYGRLLSANDVGSDPAMFGATPAAFLQWCAWRAEHAPHAMLTTATHDHKRGEDMRARLATISENPGYWEENVKRWDKLLTADVDPQDLPSGGDRYMLYQTLVGAWPLLLALDDAPGVAALAERIAAWQTKSVRETKLRSSWFTPDEPYEAACQAFLDRLMQGAEGGGVLAQMVAYVQHLAPAGALNSYAATVLRLTTPGVPDLYQGCDGWDFSLVDPDNRRPVDFKGRRRDLDALALDTASAAPAGLLSDWRDGRLKQALIARLLAHRRDQPALYGDGDFTPLAVSGVRADHVLAFLRRGAGQSLVVIVPRLATQGIDHDTPTHPLPMVSPDFWGDTAVALPQDLARRPLWDLLARCDRHIPADGVLGLSEVLSVLPVAVLTLQ
jgi:(1->4)-alpha-D-glucan 1-alpha-D-glucosylmutase